LGAGYGLPIDKVKSIVLKLKVKRATAYYYGFWQLKVKRATAYYYGFWLGFELI
jgi:hypothetical protein